MKKIKFLIASMLGAIALVFACVLGTKVNASTTQTTTTHTLNFNDNGSTVEKVDGETVTSNYYFSTAGKNGSGSVGIKTGLELTGHSVINNADNHTYSRAAKLESGSYINFTVSSGVTYDIYVVFTKNNIKLNNSQVTSYTSTELANVQIYSLSVTDETSSTVSYSITRTSEVHVFEVVVAETADSESITSISSVSVNGSYKVGDTITKSDLTVMAKYGEETEPVEISKYDYKVYDSNDDEVTGAFATAGEGYYVEIISKEDSSITKKSSTFTVGEQTLFTYVFGDYLTSDDSSAADHKINDTITFNAKYKSNSTQYNFEDGTSFSSNMAQGNKIDLHLTKAATVTVYALQSGSTTGLHDVRYMYFEDSQGNSVVSNMNFSVSGTKNDAKVGIVVLPAGDYISYCSDNGTFNMFAVVIDFTDSASLNPDVSVKLRLEQSTGTALSGTGIAARFVGVLQGVDYTVIDSIEINFTLTLKVDDGKGGTTTTTKKATKTINNVYTGLPGYDVTNNTVYFYFVISGLEKEKYVGCSIQAFSKVTYTNITEHSYSATTWNNA